MESGPRRGTFVTFNPPRLLAKERRARLKPHVDGLVAEARLLGFAAEEVVGFIEEAFGESAADADASGTDDEARENAR